jgi:hypothetical protein
MAVLKVDDFSGSLTDFYIGQAPNQYSQADNFIIDEYGKLVTRQGTLLDFTTNLTRARVPTSVSTRRIGLLLGQTYGTARNFTAVKQVGERLYYDNGTTMVELTGPGSAGAFVMAAPVAATTSFAYAEWQNHTFITHEAPYQRPLKAFNNSAGTLTLVTAGLPVLANTFTATGGPGPTTTYIYALVLKYSYTVGDVDYIDRGRPVLKEVTGVGTTVPATNPNITLNSIPTLANTGGSGELYDTTGAVIEIYRTQSQGAVLYKVGEIANGTTTFNDTVTDNALLSNEPIYTTGGVAPNDRPPKCKFVHATTDFVYWAHGIEVSPTSADIDILPQRLWQSKRGDGDSVPSSFFADAEEPITGISSVKSIPVVFCRNSIYRADGFYDNVGRGGIVLKKISDSVGAVGHLSLVQTLDGIYFAGNDGFYFTDGYSVQPVTTKIKIQYTQLVNSELKRKRICGAYDIVERRILWATSRPGGEAYDDDNAQFYVCDLDSKAITTNSSGFLKTEAPDQVKASVANTGAVMTMADTTGIDVGALVFRDSPTSPIAPGTYVVAVNSATQVTISTAPANLSGITYKFYDNGGRNTLFRNMLPTSVLYANDAFYFGDVHGFTRRFEESEPSDVWIDASGATAPASMEKQPIFFNYESVALDLGTTSERKYVWQILTKARPRLDVNAEMTLQIVGENDDNGLTHSLEPIFFESFFPWGTPLVNYGDPRLYRIRRSIIDVKRRFPATKLRCEYKQIEFTPGFVNILFSLALRLANITSGPNAVTKTVTLASGTFNDAMFNYWLSFEADGYVRNYRVVQVNSTSQVVVLDPEGTLATATGQKWVVRGFLKNALINMIEYSIFFEVLGSSQQQYQGENAVSQ